MQKTVLFLFLGGSLLTGACSPAYSRFITTGQYEKDTLVIPDYGRQEYWAASPGKSGPADSIPAPLQALTVKDTGVDVFFLHPTTFTDDSDPRWNAGINDPAINAKTDYSTILFQASAFNECRLYAPRYRQAHIRAYFTSDTASARKAFDLAYGDIKAAFDYYLAHHNNGRPIIIASHSQGTTHAKRLLKEYFEEGQLKNRLVAAYIIGMPLPRNYFTSLSPCSDSTKTGCFVGWRTFLEGFEPEYVQKEDPASYVVNPLTWKTTEEYAPRSLNQGAVLKTYNKVVRKVVDAQIHGGVLWVNRPHFPGSILVRTKNYHIGDINLFYLNIRNNVRTRIRYYRMQMVQGNASAGL